MGQVVDTTIRENPTWDAADGGEKENHSNWRGVETTGEGTAVLMPSESRDGSGLGQVGDGPHQEGGDAPNEN